MEVDEKVIAIPLTLVDRLSRFDAIPSRNLYFLAYLIWGGNGLTAFKGKAVILIKMLKENEIVRCLTNLPDVSDKISMRQDGQVQHRVPSYVEWMPALPRGRADAFHRPAGRPASARPDIARSCRVDAADGRWK
jgi:hypothetical protein